MLVGKPRMCLALPRWRKGNSLAQVDVEGEAAHEVYECVRSVLVRKARKWW